MRNKARLRRSALALLVFALVARSYSRTRALFGAARTMGPRDFSFHPTSPGANDRRGDAYDYPFAFSACLLFMDDNAVLPEWLAYHYHFLPLRHLIIGVDPYGATSPDAAVLDPWRRDMGMTIEVWNDGDYCFDGCQPDGPAGRDRMSSHQRLLARQVQFYRRCLARLREANRSWTTVTDVDEYLAFNHVQPEEDESKRGIAESPRPRLPPPGNHSTTAADFIRSEAEYFSRHACHYLPRIFFGPRGGGRADADEAAVRPPRPAPPAGFDAALFQTYRYRFHDPWRKRRGMGKSIVDASQYVEGDDVSAHRALKGRCSGIDFDSVVFRVRHYIGSLEAFMSRPLDHRRTEEGYFQTLADFSPQGPNDDITGWFSKFAEKVGEGRAIELTQHATVRALEQAREMKMGFANGTFQ